MAHTELKADITPEPIISLLETSAPDEISEELIHEFEPESEDDLEDKEAVELLMAASPARRTTDLVRLYLQEIGRVDLLRRDEEVAESQKVQRYLELKEKLIQANDTGNDQIIQAYAHLLEVHDRLVSILGHRPSYERWAHEANVKISELKPLQIAGKQRWAQVAGISVAQLDQIQKDGQDAKEHMIKANLRLVVSVAKKYQNRGMELLDLIQEGTMGLERAVEKFDTTKGYRFSTYAYWWIRQGITRAIATSSRTIRLPVHITEKLNKIKKAQRKITQEKGANATLDEIGQQVGMTGEQVREILLKVPRSVSLEIKVGKDKDTELGELIETDNLSPEETLIQEALYKELEKILADLTHREREVIKMRYGLGDGRIYSLSEIGKALDLSRERVRQIEAKALQKLRQPKRRNLLRDYIETMA